MAICHFEIKRIEKWLRRTSLMRIDARIELTNRTSRRTQIRDYCPLLVCVVNQMKCSESDNKKKTWLEFIQMRLCRWSSPCIRCVSIHPMITIVCQLRTATTATALDTRSKHQTNKCGRAHDVLLKITNVIFWRVQVRKQRQNWNEIFVSFRFGLNFILTLIKSVHSSTNSSHRMMNVWADDLTCRRIRFTAIRLIVCLRHYVRLSCLPRFVVFVFCSSSSRTKII